MPKTGPKTPAGKARSSQNATRHGLAGRVVVLPSEDLNLYHRFCEEFIADLHPETAVEREYAQTIADGHWRLRRVRTTEDSLYALGHDEGQGDFDADHPETSTPPTPPPKPSATTPRPSPPSPSMNSAFSEASKRT